MAPYTFVLHDPDDGVRVTLTASFADDDDAIDHAGTFNHPDEIKVWQGERLVARFPAGKTALGPLS